MSEKLDLPAPAADVFARLQEKPGPPELVAAALALVPEGEQVEAAVATPHAAKRALLLLTTERVIACAYGEEEGIRGTAIEMPEVDGVRVKGRLGSLLVIDARGAHLEFDGCSSRDTHRFAKVLGAFLDNRRAPLRLRERIKRRLRYVPVRPR
ncbi:hypothetical protein KRX56_03275 [Dermabacteraceae bacterium TAE3-ERU27]|nr:hypothetical protein [Dermabacteraceae bacterium TAE3-ERU27]